MAVKPTSSEGRHSPRPRLGGGSLAMSVTLSPGATPALQGPQDPICLGPVGARGTVNQPPEMSGGPSDPRGASCHMPDPASDLKNMEMKYQR